MPSGYTARGVPNAGYSALSPASGSTLLSPRTGVISGGRMPLTPLSRQRLPAVARPRPTEPESGNTQRKISPIAPTSGRVPAGVAGGDSCPAGDVAPMSLLAGRTACCESPKRATRLRGLAQLDSDVRREVLLPWDYGPSTNPRLEELHKFLVEPRPGPSLPPLAPPIASNLSQQAPSLTDKAPPAKKEPEPSEVTVTSPAAPPTYGYAETALDMRCILVSIERDILELALRAAHDETKEEDISMYVEGKSKRSSVIPDCTSSAHQFMSFTCNIILRAIKHDLIFKDQWKVLLESPVKSWYEPVISRFPAVVVCLKLDRVTQLVESHADKPLAPERIGEKVNNLFRHLLTLVEQFDGDVVKMTGDSMLIAWAIEDPAPPVYDNLDATFAEDYAQDPDSLSIFTRIKTADDDSSEEEEVQNDEDGKEGPNETRKGDGDDLADSESLQSSESSFAEDEDAVAITAAAQFCLHVQKGLPEGGTSCHGIVEPKIGFRLSCGNGDLALLQLGGLLGRWEYCVSGSAMEQTLAALDLASEGESVFSHEAKSVVQEMFEFDPVSDDPDGFARLRGLKAEATPTDRRPDMFYTVTRPQYDDINLRLVKRFVPIAVALRLCGSSNASPLMTQMEEIRRISVVDISITGLNPASGLPRRYFNGLTDGRELQLVMRLIQRTIYGLEGTVNKFTVENDGVRLLIFFGLPPLVHYTDDPIRAALCAMRLCDCLEAEGIEGKVGVATGRCWCGVVGTLQRREYIVIGDTVRRAAKLNDHAGMRKVFVDDTTHQIASEVLLFKDEAGFTELTTGLQRVYSLDQPLKGLKRHRKELIISLTSWPEFPARLKLQQALEANSRKSGVLVIHGPGGAGKMELTDVVKAWARERGWTMLAGQNIDPSGIFALHRLSLQEAFGELVNEASKDPFWRNKAWELLVSSLGTDNSVTPDVADSLGHLSRRTGVPAHAEMYWMLIAMFRQSMGDEMAADMEPWAPLLSLVVMQLAFAPRMVSAMVERDEQHARNNRFAELCCSVLDGFSRYGTIKGGTVLLIHIRRDTAFEVQPDKKQLSVLHALGELAMRRRAEASEEGEPRPLMICVVSREEAVGDEFLLKAAKECNGVVEAEDLDLRQTADFLDHLMSIAPESLITSGSPSPAPSSSARSENSDSEGPAKPIESPAEQEMRLRKVVAEYLHTMTGGNPNTLQELFKHLKKEKVIRVTIDGEQYVHPSFDDLSVLRLLEVPQKLLGVAFSFFERLDPMEQTILKALSSCPHEVGSLNELKAALPTIGVDRIETTCENLLLPAQHALVRQNMGGPSVSRVAQATNTVISVQTIEQRRNSQSCTGYRFYSGLLRHAVSLLVLETQRSEVRKSCLFAAPPGL